MFRLHRDLSCDAQRCLCWDDHHGDTVRKELVVRGMENKGFQAPRKWPRLLIELACKKS